MDSPLSLALGATGTSGLIIGLIWYLVARGLHSKCLIAGNSVTLEIRKETAEEKNARTHSHTEIVVLPTETPTVIDVPAQPKSDVPKHPKKTIRVSAQSETPRAV